MRISQRAEKRLFDLDDCSSKSVNFFKKENEFCVSLTIRKFEDEKNQ